ncbi:MAG TPA: antibiotic biosynthesis monooxygenase [Candidatus Acidoferrum sp.]|nr:antibiotic biosynthesis monooxygenase [Candidatus Acidoferrum sp.]
MFVVIFEVQPKAERWDEYLALAKQLKPKLEAIDGFLDNDRFRSKRTEGRLLSLSTWRDEKAVVRWRSQGEHHGAQQRGRFEVFQDYHLRVGEVTADTRPPPSGVSLAQQRLDETEVGAAKAVTITEVTPGGGADPDLADSLGLASSAGGLVEHELFESIYNAGKILLLASWHDAGAASAWKPASLPDAQSLRHRRVRVVRDYGMFDRREAPQFYPEVKRRS